MANGWSECRNKRCARYRVRIYADPKRGDACLECMSRLRHMNDEAPSDAEVRQQVEQLSFPIDGVTSVGDDESIADVLAEWDKSHLYAPHEAGGTYTQIKRAEVIPPKGNDTFTCNLDVKGCPVVAKLEPEILIPYQMFNRWIFLAKEFETEWFAFLKGEKKEDGSYEITDMYFPPQKANGAHVSVEDGHILEGTIAAVHSHVNMTAHFSGEDEQHANFDVEMVINRKGDIGSSVRIQLECGRYQRIEGKVMLASCEEELALASQLVTMLTT